MYPSDISLGSDPKKIRNYNRMLILELIRGAETISKGGISRKTGISFSTVSRIVDELAQENLIKSLDKLDRGGGRPGELFEFDGNSHFVIGADLGFPNLRGYVADLSGRIFKEITCPVDMGNGVENFRRVIQMLTDLQAENGTQVASINGVGLGITGIVDHTSGVVVQSPILGWDNFPLARRLHQETGLTIFLDSDINLITIGEYGFGIGKGAANMAVLTLGTRVLCGLVLRGEIYRGSNLNSGRLDQFIPSFDPFCKNQAAECASLDSIVASINVLKTGQEKLTQGDPLQYRTLDDPRQVYQAFSRGETWAVEAMQPAIQALATAVGNINNLLDLELIVISGRMADESRHIIPSIINALNGKIPSVPHITASNLGPRATMFGAIMLVYQGLLQNW